LVARGVDVDAQVDAELNTPEAAVIYDDPAIVLDTEALWKRDALRHRILSRAEEAELTHRYTLFQRTAMGLRTSRERTEKKLVAARVAREHALAALTELKVSTRKVAAKRMATAEADFAETSRRMRELEREIVTIGDEIAEAEQAAKKAEETFLAHNFKLVAHMAYNKHKAINRRGSLMDLIQQGNIGMLEAFRKFDPTRGFKFSTFATWYINQKISEWSYEQIGSIRVPTHRWRDKRRMEKLEQEFLEAYQTAPSVEEIAEHMGKSVKNVSEVMRAKQLMNTGSLDKPTSDEDGSATLGELIADSRGVDPEHEVVAASLAPVFESAFSRCLDARERRVIMLRMGMYDGERHTLDWIGKRMKITRERVRQIEAKALEKLRDDNEIKAMLGDELIAAMAGRRDAA
jgi:RNA polymerase primary sigma factor